MGQIQEKRMVEANPEQMMNDQCKGEQGKRRVLFYTWRRKQAGRSESCAPTDYPRDKFCLS